MLTQCTKQQQESLFQPDTARLLQELQEQGTILVTLSQG